MPTLPTSPLLAGLVDDAAVFPPGLAPMPDAVPAHRRHRRAWYGPLIGPFLVPVAQLTAFEQALDAHADDDAHTVGEALAVSLIADRAAADPLPSLLHAVQTLRHRRRDVETVAVEVALGPGPRQPHRARHVASALDAALPGDTLAWVEVHRADDLGDTLAVLAGSGARVRAKFRTGGAEATALPSAVELALVLRAAVRLRLPLKLTAGLHHALPGTDPVTELDHHGFLAVLAAVAAAQDGAAIGEVADVLRGGDQAAVTERLAALDDDRARAVRSVFCSFGCCEVTDPVDDLVRLGLVTPPTGDGSTTARFGAGPEDAP